MAFDFGWQRLYNIELWTPGGSLLADISPVCQNREYILTRNAPEQFTFQIDLTAFEKYCASINVDPNDLIAPYKTDVKVKRNGEYLFVVQVVGLEFDFQPADNGVNPETGSYSGQTTLTETVTVTCAGYLDVLKDRYITFTYDGYDPAAIAADLLFRTQSEDITPGGAFGVQIPPGSYHTGTTIDELVLTEQQVLEEIQLLTESPDAQFDVLIDPNKNFGTYQMVGSQRSDFALTYGGPGGNVTGLYHQRTAESTLYNQVIGLGAGYGAQRLTSTQPALGVTPTDLYNRAINSQVNYFLRQSYSNYDHVRNQAQLDLYTAADLARYCGLLEAPQFIINGSAFMDKQGNQTIPFVGVGDRIPVYFPTHPFMGNLDGQYLRTEVLDVKIDDNDYEYEITLTMDSYGLNITV